MVREQGRRAVFLDRDGVLNPNVFYADTRCWESPRAPDEFRLADGIVPALAQLQAAGFQLFVVSNQPNEAKGKSAAGALDAMHAMLLSWLGAGGIALAGAFYCRHHPEFTGPCVCRKPSPHFLKQALAAYGLAPALCWMIGDRATDMECGRAAGTRTAWIRTGQERVAPAAGMFDLKSTDLPGAVEQILACRSLAGV